MPQQFNPKSVLRYISGGLLKKFFESKGHTIPIRWEEFDGAQVRELFHYWSNLSDGPRKEIELVLHDVFDMANEGGVRVLMSEVLARHSAIPPEFDALESHYDRAMWMHLHHPEIWNASAMFTRADNLSSGRSWISRNSLPHIQPASSADEIEALKKSMSAYYREQQGRGHNAFVEHFERANRQDYYFVYLSDYSNQHVNFDDRGEFHRTPDRRAFEVVFAYDRNTGRLDMFAKGGSKVIQPLQEIFARVILKDELPPEDASNPPYKLDHLMDRNFQFDRDPEDGIAEVQIQQMRLSIVGDKSRRRITLEPGQNDNIYDMLEKDLDNKNIPRSILHLGRITLKFIPAENANFRSMTFDVCTPNSCTLRSKREDIQALASKYLKRWKIDVG